MHFSGHFDHMKIRTFSFIFSFLTFSIANAQIARYDFENNLDDAISGHHGSYVEYGQVSSNPPLYSPGPTGMAVVLDSSQGMLLPPDLTSQLDTTTSIEIVFDFTLTDIGSGAGFMYLMSNQLGVNGTGFSIFTRHSVFSNARDYEVVFTYADGGFGSVPDHPGHDETRIGFFNEGEEINLQLILDFENNQWSALVNGTYTNVVFDDYYDMGLIKESIKNRETFIGWVKNQEHDLVWHPDVFAVSASFDNLAFYSPRRAGNAAVLVNALVGMTGHVNQSALLPTAELEAFLVDILLNFDGNFSEAENEVYDFISAYEANNEPVFSDRQIVVYATLPAEMQALLFLQQAIHDEQFTSSNIANVEGVKFEAADVFPGPVAASALRVSGATVDVNGSYEIIQGARIAADLDDAKRPTGYYAAPGEIVTITLPNSLLDAGLSAMIGAHDADHSILTQTNRFLRISKDFPLNAERTRVANPFGGAIYIKVPEGSDLGWFQIGIDGAVKSPYFSARTGRETPVGVWQNELAEGHVAWVDIESDKYMMTLPYEHVRTLTDPTMLMSQWDDIMDAFNYVGGRPPERTRAEYFLVDSRLPSDGFGTGYPQVVGLGDVGLYPTAVLNPNFYKDYVTTFHEMGHGALHPTLFTETESIVHLNATYIYDELYHVPIDTAFKYSSDEELVMDEAAMDWMIADNFRNNRSMSCDPTMESHLCDEVRYQHRGHAKYVDMAELFGWSAVHGMNKVFYDRWSMTISDRLVAPDDVIAAASGATELNMAPLMHFWGLQPSVELADELASLSNSDEVLALLNHYKSIVPANGSEFQSWYDILYARKDPVHYPRLDYALANYDADDYAGAIHAQIDFLIGFYFDSTTTGIHELSGNLDPLIPSEVSLLPAYPNPFNPETTIRFELPQAEDVAINIYNLHGQLVRKLVGENREAGIHEIVWDARDEAGRSMPSGVYLYRFQAGAFMEVKKLMLLR